MKKLIDRYKRKIDYLRISVTDRCNLSCIYCMPDGGINFICHDKILTFEEIEKVVKAAVSLGINKIRITGGDPLVRKGIVDLVAILSDIVGLDDLSMTTNGILLDKYAEPLKKAGLKRVNISLDSLNEDKYEFITKVMGLKDVMKGIEKAQAVGFSPVKINVVVIKGVNDNEILDFVNFSCRKNICVRFIEFMPTNSRLFWDMEKFISMNEIKKQCEDFFILEKVEYPLTSEVFGNGSAKYYKISGMSTASGMSTPEGNNGQIGFISPFSDQFCCYCNRLRLTSKGSLRSCLHNKLEIDLRERLRQSISLEEIKKLIKNAIFNKPERHCIELTEINNNSYHIMSQIGG